MIPLRSITARRDVLFHFVFWSWNTIFIALGLFGLAPEVLWPLAREAKAGAVPWDLVLTATLLVMMPAIAVVFGWAALRRAPRRLIAFFYGVEAPLLLVLVMRLFFVRQLVLGTTLVMLAIGGACAAYLHGLARPVDEPVSETARGALARLAGGSLCLLVGLWLALLIGFFAPPLAWVIAKVVTSAEFWRNALRFLSLREFLLIGLALGLFLYSATLLVAMPAALVTLFARRFGRDFDAARRLAGGGRAAAVAALVIASVPALITLANRQPQARAFAITETPPKTDDERRATLARAGEIRRGLLNAYLQRYRYLGEADRVHAVSEAWASAFFETARWERRDTFRGLDAGWNALIAPFLYVPTGDDDDQDRAAKRYADFFDEPLQRAARDAVRAALSATWKRDDREAGVLAIDEEKVHLDRQTLRVVERDGVAEIELHEIYANRTTEQQEVYYYFSLPPTAVVTGLQLGDDETGPRFDYKVSPRGAAHKVYKRIVEQRMDPALLEQIGPGQYRLRAFPVRPRPWSRDAFLDGETGPPLHLWLTFRVLPEAGTWPLPRLAEKRNVFWDRATIRTIDAGDPGLAPRGAEWLPASLPARYLRRPRAQAFEIAGEPIRAVPLGLAEGEAAPAIPSGKRYAVIVDRSRSMAARATELAAAMDYLRARVAPRNDLDLYLTASPVRGEPPARLDDPSAFDAAKTIFYGGHTLAGMIDQFESLRADTRYDAAIVLTDQGSLDHATHGCGCRKDAPPLYVVHLGGVLAPGYEDAVLAAIQGSGGAAVTRVEDAFTRLALAEANPGFIEAGGGYVFVRGDAKIAPGEAGDEAFLPFAARQRVALGVRRAPCGAASDLDALHAIATEHHFVSPYSSMIVLVDDRQREALRRAEQEADRFDRPVDSGVKSLPSPSSLGGMGLEGTPEPEEWALMIAAAAALAWSVARRRAALRLA